MAIPLSNLLGAPLSGWLLGLESHGLHGWQWMYILEGVPTVLLGVACLIWLPDNPAKAKFLTPEEVAAIETTGEMLPGVPANLPASPGNIPRSPGNIPAPAENLAADRKGIEEKGKEGNISVAAIAVEIYEAYPRRQGKQDALKAIAKTIKAGIDSKHLLERTKAFATAAGKWNVEDRQFIPHPATWFNRGSFDDDPSTWVRVGKTDKSRSGFA